MSHIAEHFFAIDPFDEEWNAFPEKACRRRLGALARAGFLRLGNDYDGRRRRRVVTLGPSSQTIVGERCERRRVPARNRAHHIRTQEALAHLARELRERGGRVVDVVFDQDVRGGELTGRRTARGDSFPAVPDAVCRVEVQHGGGTAREREIAVEYVTSKYTDVDILAKRDSFKRFDGAHWYADNARTAARVHRLTGAACTILS